MSEKLYVLRDIARLATEEELKNCWYRHCFRTLGKRWHIFDEIKQRINVTANQFITSFSKEPEFLLRIRENPTTHEPILSIFLEPNRDCDVFFSRQKDRLIQLCFEINDPTAMETDDDALNTSFTDFNELYTKLKEAHAKLEPSNDDFNLESLQLPYKLRPHLRPYQLKGVRWMLNREQVKEKLEIKPIELVNSLHPGTIFYMDRNTSKIYDYIPEPRTIPSGGLLCDEMGLGKTVEMLSLILHNPGNVVRCDEGKIDDICAPFIVPNGDVTDAKIICFCIKKKTKGKFVQCQQCKNFQHFDCVMGNVRFDTKEYKCSKCWYASPNPAESFATIIVSPNSIKYQWLSEIQKHVKDKNFRIFDYRGVKETGWISPTQLAQYDVVLTDYDVLRNEIYFTSLNYRTLRREKKYGVPVSPLPMVKWWRSCLDEAQMIETPTSQSARMVQTLPAVHRWGVTGTPIERRIESLYGLIFFLKFEPISYENVWKKLVEDYEDGNWQHLVTILQRVMWRTCKVDVLDQIGIPPQTEVIHSVEMTDLQSFFYKTEHASAANEFNKIVARYLENTQEVASITSSTLRCLLEPLRKLRFDCTVPSLFNKMPNETANKKILTPTQLHNHLIKNTEHESKTCLRTISSGFNGLAGCHIIKKNFIEAGKCYKAVLKLAQEYKSPAIHVDTLLQIHAIHNLLEISDKLKIPDEEIARYKKDLEALEAKFIDTYYLKVKDVEERLTKAQAELKKIPTHLTANKNSCGTWWQDVLYQSTDEKILEKVTLELSNRGFEQETMERKNLPYGFRTIKGLEYVITTWLDKVEQDRKNIQTKFANLNYFIDNIKPKHPMTEDDLFKRDYLIRSAFECHLDVQPDPDDQEEVDRRARVPKCPLCKVKAVLNDYECLIFDKFLVGDRVDGNWNASYQEIILRTLFILAKREKCNQEVLEQAEAALKLVDAIKDEFKEYSQYWVEINYTAAAFDELQMCKLRLEVDEIGDEKQNNARNPNMRFPKDMVNEMIANLDGERMAAELNLVRSLGKLKYLNHLKEEKQPEQCPICKQMPGERYAVLLCGHLLCYLCVTQMAKYQRNNLSCAICRAKQHFSDILYATNTQSAAQNGLVKGSFSAKITKIVETVLKIREEENGVKIVIFSTWDAILQRISTALEQNEIKFVMKKNQQFHKVIEDFKDFEKNITCLLLPLNLGSRGLNLIEATHVFLVEPILDASEEKQAVGRVHRIGQTKPTFIHRFIMKDSIEETIYNTCLNWDFRKVTVSELQRLFVCKSLEPELHTHTVDEDVNMLEEFY